MAAMRKMLPLQSDIGGLVVTGAARMKQKFMPSAAIKRSLMKAENRFRDTPHFN